MSAPNIQEALHWLEYARQDIASARKILEEGGFVLRHACFWSQQAAEKAIKAIYVYEQLEYPWRHDLDALRVMLPSGWKVKDEHSDLSKLTEWAVEARYPGEWGEPSWEEAQTAFRQGEAIVESITKDFVRRGVFEESS